MNIFKMQAICQNIIIELFNMHIYGFLYLLIYH